VARLKKIPLKLLGVRGVDKREEVKTLPDFEVLRAAVTPNFNVLELLEEGVRQQFDPGSSEVVKIVFLLGIGEQVEGFAYNFFSHLIIGTHDQVWHPDTGKIVVLRQLECRFNKESPCKVLDDETFPFSQILLRCSHLSRLVVRDLLMLNILGDSLSQLLDLVLVLTFLLCCAGLVSGAVPALFVDLVRQNLQRHLLVVTVLAVMTNTVLLLRCVDVIRFVFEESGPAVREIGLGAETFGDGGVNLMLLVVGFGYLFITKLARVTVRKKRRCLPFPCCPFCLCTWCWFSMGLESCSHTRTPGFW